MSGIRRSGRAFRPQNRVLTAGDGLDHQTLQSAVTAAEQDCAYNREYTIYAAPDVDQSHLFSDERNRQFVHIVNVGQQGRRDGILDGVLDEINVQPYITKGPALLCIRVDDGGDDILEQTFSELGDKTPADYARDRGIVMTLAVNTEYYDGTNNSNILTADQLKQLYYAYGYNPISHSHKHTNIGTDRNAYEIQIAKSVSILRNLTDSSGNHIGLPALGWAQTGGGAVPVVLNYNTAYSHFGYLIRRWCAYSQAYFSNASSQCIGPWLPIQRHFRSPFISLASTNNHSEDVAKLNRILHAASEPGARLSFLMHRVVPQYDSNYPYGMTVALYKHMIDELSTTWRGKIQTCSMDAINLAMVYPPMYTSAGPVEIMGPGWHFEDITTGMLATNTWYQSFFVYKQPGDSVTIESGGSGLHQYPDTQHLQVIRTSTSGTTGVVFQGGFRHGTHLMEFEMKSAGSTGPATVKVIVNHFKPPFNGSLGTSVWAFERLFTPTNDWTKYYLPFGVPTWATDTMIYVTAQPVSSGEERGFKLNNVEIWPL